MILVISEFSWRGSSLFNGMEVHGFKPPRRNAATITANYARSEASSSVGTYASARGGIWWRWEINPVQYSVIPEAVMHVGNHAY